MAEASNTEEKIYQNLKDAGCDKEMISSCMTLMKTGRKDEVLGLLSRHKSSLLNKVHKGQEQIDCLDFLTYQIEKENI